MKQTKPAIILVSVIFAFFTLTLSIAHAAGGRMVVATPNRHSLEVVYRKGRDLLRGRRQPASAYYAATSHLREYTSRQCEAGGWRSSNRRYTT